MRRCVGSSLRAGGQKAAPASAVLLRPLSRCLQQRCAALCLFDLPNPCLCSGGQDCMFYTFDMATFRGETGKNTLGVTSAEGSL